MIKKIGRYFEPKFQIISILIKKGEVHAPIPQSGLSPKGENVKHENCIKNI
jgi:hypothetical protein